MGECLVIGRKAKPNTKRATFVILKVEARVSPTWCKCRQTDPAFDCPKGIFFDALRMRQWAVTPLYFGEEMIGQAIDAPLPTSGGWNLSRIADLSLAQAAYQLAHEERIWLPTMTKSKAVEVPITTVEAIGKIGPYHADIMEYIVGRNKRSV